MTMAPHEASSVDRKGDLTAKESTPSASSSGDEIRPFSIYLSVTFLLSVTVGVIAISFIAGRLAFTFFLLKHGIIGSREFERFHALPLPVYPEFKQVPSTVYSSKHFDSGAVSTSDTLLARRAQQSIQSAVTEDLLKSIHPEDELHEPSGQHLLVDIKGVDGVFLNSEERLATAMISLVDLSGLTMLSYHCHKLTPIGVSCVGVLLESHISFHTWPIPGAISLDLFTCGPNSLLPILPEIERKFGVPRIPAIQGSVVEKPFMQWAHKRRGFRSKSGNPKDVDLNQFLLGWMEFDMKQMIVSEQTKHQKVEIYDVINPRFRSLETYKNSLTGDKSYEAQNPELFRPDRVLFLDGIIQSRYCGEPAYHEALVHPAMITHTGPKRVAIIGGGEGATLREVLKHNTVEKVTMIEADDRLVQISRKYLPEWSDCTMMVGSTRCCFDDPRAELIFADAVEWFVERYSQAEKVDPSQIYDVIIIDDIDLKAFLDYADAANDNDALVRSLSNALGEEGILVSQVGASELLYHAGAQFTDKDTELAFTEKLTAQGFVIIEDYSEFHGGFSYVWKYKIAMKSKSSFVRWHFNEAMIELELLDRAMSTGNATSNLFRYFDGATMMEYQYPSRVTEEVHCRSIPTPDMCERGHGWDPEHTNALISSLEVRESKIPLAGRGVFAKEDIPEGTFLAIDVSSQDVLVMPETTYWINLFRKAGIVNRWKMFDAYMFGYGFVSDYFGEPSVSIDSSILTFLNHGCNGSYNIRLFEPYSFTEMTVDPYTYPDELEDSVWEIQVYNPFVRRNHLIYQHGGESMDRDIKAGEELLDFYLNYYTEDVWERGVLELRAQCLEQGLGSVSSYEEKIGSQ